MISSLSNSSPAAVLWDMDGTVIDSEPHWLVAELRMLSRYGIELPPTINEQLVGSGLTAAAKMFQGLGVPLSTDEIIAEWAGSVTAELRRGETEWRPGAVELLASLAAAGIPSALVTMSVRSMADAVVEMLPPGSFSVIVAGDEVAHEKPDPDPYLRAAAMLGVSIDDCLAIEDSPNGLRSAHASGAVAIGVPHMVSLDETPNDELWPTLAGINAEELGRRFSRLRKTKNNQTEEQK